MTNSERFRNIFGVYATEIWALPEEEFLQWLNSEEQKTGKWLYDGSGLDYACSVCKKSLGDYVFFTEDGELAEIPNFCPNCGCFNGENNNGNE